MRFEVPQFIEIEDKIFGSLTWRQFIYVGGGGAMVGMLFISLPFVFFVIAGTPIAALAFMLGFYPVNNRPFSHYLESMVKYLSGNKLYVWHKKGEGVYTDNKDDAKGEEIAFVPPTSGSNLNSLARQLELKAIGK